MSDLDVCRETKPTTPEHLYLWVKTYTGVEISRCQVCPGHTSVFSIFAEMQLVRPDILLVIGPRGGGKSYISAIDSHCTSRFNSGVETAILGGSQKQSEQIYRALKKVVTEYDGEPGIGNDRDSIKRLLQTKASYKNRSEVSILAASATSVRGPHPSTLKLDEVDEIDTDIRESAIGMATETTQSTIKTSILMTSTWHRQNGPMSDLVEKAHEGLFPLRTFCTFEILERCTVQRSGPWVGGDDAYLNCPRCPIRVPCHAGRDDPGANGLPKAKRSSGHYTIASLIQKAHGVGLRAFRSDFLCDGPKTEGTFYPEFTEANQTKRAEYDTAFPVHLAIDSGARTAAVWFQIVQAVIAVDDDEMIWTEVHVFAEFYSDGKSAYDNARSILAIGETRCHGRRDRTVTDPAGRAKNSIGPTVLAEYERAGIATRTLESWPSYPGSVADGIALIDSFVKTGDERIALYVHPRCKGVIAAFMNYAKAKRGGQYLDDPKDPQHPHEDFMDALRGGLQDRFREGRRPEPTYRRVSASKVF